MRTKAMLVSRTNLRPDEKGIETSPNLLVCLKIPFYRTNLRPDEKGIETFPLYFLPRQEFVREPT